MAQGTGERSTEDCTHWWCVRCRASGLLHLGAPSVCDCGGEIELLPALEVEIRRAEPLAIALGRVLRPVQPMHTETRAAYPIREAAERLGVGLTKMKDLLRRGNVKTVMIGRRRHVPASELERLTTPALASPRRASAPRPARPSGADIRAAILRGGRK